MSKEKSYIERIFKVSYLLKRILVAYDGSENSEKALDVALEFSRTMGSEITIAYSCYTSMCDESIVKKALEKAESQGLQLSVKVLKTDPALKSIATLLVEEINNGDYDLVIMGVRGTSISDETVIGSTTASVFLNTSTSYLFIR